MSIEGPVFSKQKQDVEGHRVSYVVKMPDGPGSEIDVVDFYIWVMNTLGTTLISDSIKTNPITDLHNNLSIGIDNNNIHSYDGEPDSIDSFDIKLSENEYFLVGDNRENSFDSRMFGPISRDRIIGKAYFKIYPFSEFKNLND